MSLKVRLMLEQKFRCIYCNRRLSHARQGTVEHITPISRGGGGSKTGNCAFACKRCNNFKGDETLEEFGDRLRMMLDRVDALIPIYGDIQ